MPFSFYRVLTNMAWHGEEEGKEPNKKEREERGR
jgi:hypothetical protein